MVWIQLLPISIGIPSFLLDILDDCELFSHVCTTSYHNVFFFVDSRSFRLRPITPVTFPTSFFIPPHKGSAPGGNFTWNTSAWLSRLNPLSSEYRNLPPFRYPKSTEKRNPRISHQCPHKPHTGRREWGKQQQQPPSKENQGRGKQTHHPA